jgi:O-antigen/teichoic acid export membrane protein
MKNNIVNSSLIYSFTNIVSQSAMFIMLPFYSLVLSKSAYGEVAKFEVYAFLFCIFFSLALEKAAQRLFFSTNKSIRHEIIGTFFQSVFFFSLLITVLLLVVNLSGIYKIETSLLYVIGYCFFVVNGYITTSYFQLTEKPIIYASLKLASVMANCLIILFFLTYFSPSAEFKVLADLISVLIFFPVHLYIAFKYFKGWINLSILKEGLSFSLPFVPTLLISWVIILSNRLFIEFFGDLSQVGLFSMAFKISSIILLLGGAVNMAFMPYFYKTLNDTSNAGDDLKLVSHSIIILLLAIFFSFIIFIPEIINFGLSDSYAGIERLVLLLTIANFFSVFSSFTFVPYLLQSKETLYNLYASILGSLMSIFLNFLLIPKFGINGAALSLLLSTVSLCVCQYYFSKKGFYISINLKFYFFTLLIFSFVGWILIFIGTSLFVSLLKLFCIMFLILLILKNKNLTKRLLFITS